MTIAAPPMDAENLLLVGKFGGVYGIRGWLKVRAYTEPLNNLLNYATHYVKRNGVWQVCQLTAGRNHGKGLIVHVKGVDNNDTAQTYSHCDIAIPATDLPPLPKNEFYWRQLIGLQVISTTNHHRTPLGRVQYLMETGANDVLVVKGDQSSIDQRERLIPYLPQQFIGNIDLTVGTIEIDWDPSF